MQGPLSASANSTPVYRPNLSGGADRVFRVPLPLFYNFFCNSYSTVLAILLSAWAFPKILHANPHGIQSFYVVKDVGASYDGLVDSFELNSNNYTSPPPLVGTAHSLVTSRPTMLTIIVSIDVAINET
jgi:hypothetical protein